MPKRAGETRAQNRTAIITFLFLGIPLIFLGGWSLKDGLQIAFSKPQLGVIVRSANGIHGPVYDIRLDASGRVVHNVDGGGYCNKSCSLLEPLPDGTQVHVKESAGIAEVTEAGYTTLFVGLLMSFIGVMLLSLAWARLR